MYLFFMHILSTQNHLHVLHCNLKFLETWYRSPLVSQSVNLTLKRIKVPKCLRYNNIHLSRCHIFQLVRYLGQMINLIKTFIYNREILIQTFKKLKWTEKRIRSYCSKNKTVIWQILDIFQRYKLILETILKCRKNSKMTYNQMYIKVIS